jgi:hypothetical protein
MVTNQHVNSVKYCTLQNNYELVVMKNKSQKLVQKFHPKTVLQHCFDLIRCPALLMFILY